MPTIYGPKTGGAWPAGVPIVGPPVPAVDVFANRPANAVGRLFFPTDGVYQQVGDGTSWYNVVGGRPLKEPPATSTISTQTNFGTSTLTKANGVLLFTAAKTAGPNVRTAGKTIVTLASAVVTACPSTISPAGNWTGGGVYMRESGTGKIYTFCYLCARDTGNPADGQNSFSAERWSSATSRSSFADYIVPKTVSPNNCPILQRLAISGANVLAQISIDGGTNFYTIETVAKTTVFTTQPDEFGICAHVENNTTDAAHMFSTLTFAGD